MIKFYGDRHIDDNKSMFYDNHNSKKSLYYHTLNPIIDELDFKTASGRGAINLYINIQNCGTY